MNHKDFIKLLKRINACSGGVSIVRKNKWSLAQAWKFSPRGQWSLWLVYSNKNRKLDIKAERAFHAAPQDSRKEAIGISRVIKSTDLNFEGL